MDVKAIFVSVILALLVFLSNCIELIQGQMYHYSNGWTPGKRQATFHYSKGWTPGKRQSTFHYSNAWTPGKRLAPFHFSNQWQPGKRQTSYHFSNGWTPGKRNAFHYSNGWTPGKRNVQSFHFSNGWVPGKRNSDIVEDKFNIKDDTSKSLSCDITSNAREYILEILKTEVKRLNDECPLTKTESEPDTLQTPWRVRDLLQTLMEDLIFEEESQIQDTPPSLTNWALNKLLSREQGDKNSAKEET